MKTAIVYYSLSGNVEYVAEKIAQNINADLIRIAPVKEYPVKGLRKFFHGGKSSIAREEPALKPYQFNGDEYDSIRSEDDYHKLISDTKYQYHLCGIKMPL